MRGEDRTSGALFSYVDVEARIAANHQLRAMRRLTNAALAELDASVFGALRGYRPPLDSAGAIVARCAVAASLFDPLGAAIGRTAGVRHAVSLVRRAVGSTSRCSTPRGFRRTATACSRTKIAQGFLSSLLGLPEVKRLLSARGFFGRRNDVEGVGVDEELPSQELPRAKTRGTARTNRLRPGATAKGTSGRPSGRTGRTPRRPTRTRGFIEKAMGRRAGWPISATP